MSGWARLPLLALLLALLALQVQRGNARGKGLRMSRVLGGTASRNSGRSGGSQPWGSGGGRNQLFEARNRMEKNRDKFSQGPEACVGLCYYMKILELEHKKRSKKNKNGEKKRRRKNKKNKNKRDKDDNGRRSTTTTPRPKSSSSSSTSSSPSAGTTAALPLPFPRPYPWELTSTEAPCVGLCYIFKKKGEENPYEDWFP